MEVIVWPDLGPWSAPQPASPAEPYPALAAHRGLAPGGAAQSENDPPREAPEAERDQHRRRSTVE